MDQGLLLNVGQLLLGILILVYSGNYLVKGGVALANHFKVSTLVIGLTVIAFGTSAPELIVSFEAAMTGHPEIALGNIIGSNIANIALVLALTVIILPMPVVGQTIKRSWPFMFFSGIVLYGSMYNGNVGHPEGMFMFFLLLVFIVGSIRSSKVKTLSDVPEKAKNKYPLWVYVMMVLSASVGLAIGSKFLVIGASAFAAAVGVSERVISLTVVAFGTSIPELTASVIAAFKKETDISVGNIIGSNIFNVFAVIGITSWVHIIPLDFQSFSFDLNIMMIFYVLLFIFILPLGYLIKKDRLTNLNFLGRIRKLDGGQISRLEGVILFSFYICYIYLTLNHTH
jgi:cation:H+ antiporter